MGDRTDIGGDPEYTVDVDGGAFNADPGDDNPAQPSGEPEAAAAPETPGAPMDAAAAAGGDEGPAGGETVEEYIERFPKRRLAEIVQGRNEAVAAARAFKSILDSVMERLGGKPGAPQQPEAPPAQEDPKAKQIRERLYEVVPALKLLDKLQERFDAVIEAADMVGETKVQSKAYWDAVALHTTNSLFDQAAVMFGGQGKLGKDLPDPAKAKLHEDFAQWVMRDQTGQRRQRYESLDSRLVGEFLTAVRTTYVDPLRRSVAAPVVRRAKAQTALPRGGAGAPTVTAPPKPKMQDEEAVHSAAWKNLQQAIAAAK